VVSQAPEHLKVLVRVAGLVGNAVNHEVPSATRCAYCASKTFAVVAINPNGVHTIGERPLATGERPNFMAARERKLDQMATQETTAADDQD
jgi:hypothetical protein